MSFLMNERSKKFGRFATRRDFSLFRTTSCLETLKSVPALLSLSRARSNKFLANDDIDSILLHSLSGCWMGSDPNTSCSTAAFHCCFDGENDFQVSRWLLHRRAVFMDHCCWTKRTNDLWLPNDHYWALFLFPTWLRSKNCTIFNFFSFLVLARSDFHHPHTISCQPATTTSWCSPIFRATSQCLCHRSSSPSTPTKSSRAAGIHQTSHSCQHPLIKLQDYGRCLQSRCGALEKLLFIYFRDENFVKLLYFWNSSWRMKKSSFCETSVVL